MTDAGSFGIQWAAVVPGGAGLASYANPSGGGAPGAATINQTLLGAAAAQKGDYKSIAGLDQNVYIGLVSGKTTIGGKTIPSVAALADMLATNSQANLLGRPTILTLDNEEANIMVGNNIGVPNGTFVNSANSSSGQNTTYSRVDLGTSLKIKPLIIEDGTIMLSIAQEDSKVTDYNPPSNAGPTFAKRNLKTEILVSDGQMIAIGGMINDATNSIKQGIPLLMDIPFLGWFFSWQGKQHLKTSMFIFLRPVIVRNSYGVQALTNEKYQYILGQEKEVNVGNNFLIPESGKVNMETQVPWSKSPPPKGQSRAQYLNEAIKNDKDGIIDLRNIKSDSKLQDKTPASETILK
jgi:general secretion pathway protein D